MQYIAVSLSALCICSRVADFPGVFTKFFFLNHEFLIWIYFAQYHIETDFFRNEIFNVRSMLVEDRHTNELRNGFFIDVITVLEYSVLKGSASISTRPKIWPDMTEGARKSGKK